MSFTQRTETVVLPQVAFLGGFFPPDLVQQIQHCWAAFVFGVSVTLGLLMIWQALKHAQSGGQRGGQ